MDIAPSDVAKVDQLIAAMRTHAEVLGEFKTHLSHTPLTEAEIEAVIIQWNQAIVDTIFAHSDG